jgi:hypothetical protein
LFVCHVEISQTIVPPAALWVLLESPQWITMKQLGFMIFLPIVKKLLNIERFFLL